MSHPCEIERNKLKFFRVKKFILFEVRRIWSGRVINFSEKVENLSFYELGWPFSFLPLFFWEKKNGEEFLGLRKKVRYIISIKLRN
ncbi:MAG TPA: hypothetical protein DCS08_02515 [Candidatus Moranbacteria bacterium]|nr:hypothetical protein [Candidatus Moranbacteria bacterium]HBY10998.1 hypothetical protein [Candidatus Moranbacteria bacterium]